MALNVKISEAQNNDLLQVYNLLESLAMHHKMQDKFKISRSQFVQDRDLYGCLVAKVNNKLVGIATYFFSYHTWAGRSIYLDDLFVLDEFRRRGIGGKLFRKLIQIAKNENCVGVRWQVAEWNTSAINFYSKFGAKLDSVERSCKLEQEAIAKWSV